MYLFKINEFLLLIFICYYSWKKIQVNFGRKFNFNEIGLIGFDNFLIYSEDSLTSSTKTTTSDSSSTFPTSSIYQSYYIYSNNFDQSTSDFEIDQSLNVNLITSEYIQSLMNTITDITSISKNLLFF